LIFKQVAGRPGRPQPCSMQIKPCRLVWMSPFFQGGNGCMNDQHIPVNRINFSHAPQGAEGAMELSQRVDMLAARVDALAELVKAAHGEQLDAHGELLTEQGERLDALERGLGNHGE
jgi:outer membrane murein-binding lipoprotein Lpp